MGLLKSSIELHRSAPPSSAWPVLKDMLSTDDLREARQQARIIAPHTCIRRIQSSPPISCCGTPELREGLQCLEQVGDAPQAAGEPGCHAAQDTLGLLVRASAFSGRGMVEGIPLAGGDGEVERE